MSRIDRPALPSVTPPPWALRAAMAARRGVGSTHDAMTLPLLRLLEQTVSMARVQATATFARLGVADVLESGPARAARLAAALDVDAVMLDRLLRFLATQGIVDRKGDTFALTSTSDLLRRNHPDSVRDWIIFQGSPWQWHAWEALDDGMASPGTTPFEHAHGRAYFDHLAHDPDAGATFDAAMEAVSRLQWSLVVEAVGLAGDQVVCDVGGGTGAALATILQAHDDMQGILLELPAVVERAESVLAQAGVADRVELVAGDMFDRVPPGADTYVLSAVLHDWPDDLAVAILRRVREAMGPGGRVLVVEVELPGHDGASMERAFDLLMLVLGGGRERTRTEFEHLHAAAGLALTDDTVLANGWHVHELRSRPT